MRDVGASSESLYAATWPSSWPRRWRPARINLEALGRLNGAPIHQAGREIDGSAGWLAGQMDRSIDSRAGWQSKAAGSGHYARGGGNL